MPEPLEGERGDQRLGLRGSPRCPSSAGRTTSRRSRGGRARASSDRPVTPIGPVLAVVDQEVEQLAALALGRQARRCRPPAARRRVRAPREVAGHVGVGGQLEQPRRVGGARVAERQRRAGDHQRIGLVRHAGTAEGLRSSPARCYKRRDGRLPLRRPRQPARARGRAARRARGRARSAGCSAATTRCSAAGRARRVGAAARARAGDLDPRQRRALDRRSRRRAGRATIVPGRDRRRPRSARRARWSTTSPSLPATASHEETLVCHGSPVSDVRSFFPEPGEDEEELLGGVEAPRVLFGHTHLPVPAHRRPAGPSWSTPGSVGMPLDGDPRAAYALVHPDGRVEHRRVAYDHARERRARARGGRGGGVGGDGGRAHRAGALRRPDADARASSRPSRAAAPAAAARRRRPRAHRRRPRGGRGRAGERQRRLRRDHGLRPAGQRAHRPGRRRAAPGQPRALARRRRRAAAGARTSCAGCCCCSPRRCAAGTPACASSWSSWCSGCSSAASCR